MYRWLNHLQGELNALDKDPSDDDKKKRMSMR